MKRTTLIAASAAALAFAGSAVQASPAFASHHCGSAVTVSNTTSCAFAVNVEKTFSRIRGLSRHISYAWVSSPVTHKQYRMQYVFSGHQRYVAYNLSSKGSWVRVIWGPF